MTVSCNLNNAGKVGWDKTRRKITIVKGNKTQTIFISTINIHFPLYILPGPYVLREGGKTNQYLFRSTGSLQFLFQTNHSDLIRNPLTSVQTQHYLVNSCIFFFFQFTLSLNTFTKLS